MATNTTALKNFAQQTRAKLISLVQTKLQFVLHGDSAELRGYEKQIDKLRREIASKTEKIVVEEVAYTWFNRVMALRFMDANGYNSPMVVSPVEGQTRPEILQDAMGGSIDEELRLSSDDKLLPEAKLYRKLLIAVCNQKNESMPFLFEHIADYSELLLPDDLLSEQSFVYDIRQSMTEEDCQNVELMGWLYQFYIIDRKADAEVKKGKKGGLKSDEQAAATQLFTPHWVVRYMVENSLGKIWMTLHPDSALINEMPYYIQSPEGQVDPIPEDIHSAADIRFIDPCMGSGHVLVYAFDLFTKMYEEEGALHKDIPGLILTNNIFGIDIDPRCYQLASFALTMKARAYYSRYLRRAVAPQVIALQNVDHDTIASAGNWPKDSLMWQFENIDTIGSLLKITPEECAAIKVESGLFGAEQQVLKTQAEFLSGSYHCVVTNPPYLGKGFGYALKTYASLYYPNTQIDTMAMFMERCQDFICVYGQQSMINQASWMFKSTYKEFRKTLINSHDYNFESILYLGPNAFDEIKGEVVQSVSFVVVKSNITPVKCYYLKDSKTSEDKCLYFLKNKQNWILSNFSSFSEFSGYQFGFWINSKVIPFCKTSPIAKYGDAKQGLKTGSNTLFIRNWHEIAYNKVGLKWFHVETGGDFRKWYGNGISVLNWENDGYEIKNFKTEDGRLRSRPQGLSYSFKEGLTWSTSAGERPSFRYSDDSFLFESSGSKFFLENHHNDLAVFASYFNSYVCKCLIEIFSPGIGITEGAIKSLPFLPLHDKEYVKYLGAKNINISKLDWDAHETSWDFQITPLFDAMLGDVGMSKSQFNHSRMAAKAREGVLLSEVYKNYTEQWEHLFKQLHANEEELNRQFIEIYGLQDELTPDVPLKEITILQKGEITIEDNRIVWHEDVVIKQFISYLVGCYMGRYSVDKPGLIIASQGQDLSTLELEVEGIDGTGPSTIAIDDDGIIPFVQEPDFFADDMTQRIEAAIKKIFGEPHYHDNLKFVNKAVGGNLREYLYKTFYTDHVQMYSKRPIYWLFSSKMGDKKKKGYFKALVYMHRLEADTLSKLHADYVHPYIEKVEMQCKEAENEAVRDDLSTAQRNKANKLVDELKAKAREVRAFEQQLVEMASHRVTIDLDDGVKVNYPKFYPLVETIKGLENSDE